MSFLGMFFGGKTSAYENITVLGLEEYKRSIANKDVQLVDVRTAREYDSGHIENAKNVDFFSAKFLKKMEAFKKDKPVYVYCRSGNRSMKAAKKLIAAGFNEVFDLKGGYMSWK